MHVRKICLSHYRLLDRQSWNANVPNERIPQIFQGLFAPFAGSRHSRLENVDFEKELPFFLDGLGALRGGNDRIDSYEK